MTPDFHRTPFQQQPQQQLQQQQQKQAQQMQQQMQQQQQQRNVMGWLKRQEDQKRQQEQEQQAAQASSAQARAPSGAPVFQADARFAQVEQEVEKLRQDLAAGKLDEKAFQEKASALMIRDQQGAWWMVGAQSGSWYRYDGVGWSQATPPGKYLDAAPAILPPSIEMRKRTPCFWRAVATLFIVALGLILFWAMGLLAGIAVFQNTGGPEILLVEGPVWLFGSWVTYKLARKMWQS